MPGLNVYYGPDTYMGRNLAAMLRAVSELPDQDVAALHPAHTAPSVRALLPRLHVFQEGACVVHHLFGAGVTELVRAAYGDAYLTAHFEVRGCCFRPGSLSCSSSSCRPCRSGCWEDTSGSSPVCLWCSWGRQPALLMPVSLHNNTRHVWKQHLRFWAICVRA